MQAATGVPLAAGGARSRRAARAIGSKPALESAATGAAEQPCSHPPRLTPAPLGAAQPLSLLPRPQWPCAHGSEPRSPRHCHGPDARSHGRSPRGMQHCCPHKTNTTVGYSHVVPGYHRLHPRGSGHPAGQKERAWSPRKGTRCLPWSPSPGSPHPSTCAFALLKRSRFFLEIG